MAEIVDVEVKIACFVPYGHMTRGRVSQQKTLSLKILDSSQMNPFLPTRLTLAPPSARVTVHVSIQNGRVVL